MAGTSGKSQIKEFAIRFILSIAVIGILLGGAKGVGAELILVDSRQELSNLLEVDRSSGNATILRTTQFGQLFALTFDPVSKDLYGATHSIGSDGQPQQDAMLLNVSTGTIIGSLGVGRVGGMGFDSVGNLYAVDSPRLAPREPDPTARLLLVDKTTGAGIIIGDIATGEFKSLAFNSSDILYGVSRRRIPFGSSVAQQEELLTISVSTGVGSLVGIIGEAGSGGPILVGLAFDENDMLFGVGDSDNVFISIDASTAAPTEIGPLFPASIGNPQGLTFASTDVNLPAPPFVPAVALLIDEDSIDNGTNCSDVEYATGDDCVSIEECAFGACPFVGGPPIDNDPSVLVNDDIASIPGVDGGCQAVLTFNAIPGAAEVAGVAMPSITLPTGEVGDEGLFSPATDAFRDLPGGVPGYINCLDKQDEHYLDGLAGAPLDKASIIALEGRRVCAVVHDSDVSDLGDGQLNAMGARKGRTAFDVTRVVPHPKGDKLLPVLEVDFLAADEVDDTCTCEKLETVYGEPFECATDG